MALVCSGFTCQPPVSDPEQLTHMLREANATPTKH
jgi:uncharacterized protein YyaL (SSP411 family)